MAEIRVPPESLLFLVDHMEMLSEDLANDTQDIQYLLSELDSQIRWTSTADAPITHAIDEAKDNIDHCKQLCDALDTISRDLREIHKVYLDAERTTVAQINASLRNMA